MAKPLEKNLSAPRLIFDPSVFQKQLHRCATGLARMLLLFAFIAQVVIIMMFVPDYFAEQGHLGIGMVIAIGILLLEFLGVLVLASFRPVKTEQPAAAI